MQLHEGLRVERGHDNPYRSILARSILARPVFTRPGPLADARVHEQLGDLSGQRVGLVPTGLAWQVLQLDV